MTQKLLRKSVETIVIVYLAFQSGPTIVQLSYLYLGKYKKIQLEIISL